MPTGIGNALICNDTAANSPIKAIAAANPREGRHSIRNFGDALDEFIDFLVGRTFAAHEPLPKLIVLAVQQP
jgi:hypothetical protein